MKKLLILHTGGTIAMQENPTTGVIQTKLHHPLLEATLSLPIEATIHTEELFNLPSPHITPFHMLQLKERIQQAISEDFDGIVITHGTDTLEETAFFLDTTIETSVPIIITGAMRSSNELGSDGLYNLLNAIRVAAHPGAVSMGVLVVMNDEIHTARYVTKTHTSNIATFLSPTLGPVGLINKNHIFFLQKLLENPHLDVKTVDGLIPIVKAYAGMHGELLDALAQTNIDGLVIEAFGAGNLPPETTKPLQQMIKQGIPVVLVSRCFNGVAEPVYHYPGGGKELSDIGVIFCPNISSQKARLKLLIAQNNQLSPSQLSEFMEN